MSACKRARDARSSGECLKLPDCEGAYVSCPHSNLTSSSPFSGNSLKPYCLSERRIIHSAVTAPVSPTGRSSRSLCKCWCSAAPSLLTVISEKGKPAPLQATKRWVVERTNSWNNAHKKLAWCTERRDRVIDFWVAFSDVVIIVRRLIREGWSRYRWEERPHRRP